MKPKRILLLGATGGTGQQILTQALQQGHHVTALVRNPERLTVRHERLCVMKGDVLQDKRPLAEAVYGQDVVISTLGVGNGLKSGALIERSMPAIIAAMQQAGVPRLIHLSAFGVGHTVRDVPLLPRIMQGLLLRDIYADKAAGAATLQKSDLDWTVIYATLLTNGAPTGHYRMGERLTLRGFPTIARADVAHFMLTQVEDRRFLHKGVLVSG